MSLMEPTQSGYLSIDPLFDVTQGSIWTADKQIVGVAWVASFNIGNCSGSVVAGYSYYVRAVHVRQWMDYLAL